MPAGEGADIVAWLARRQWGGEGLAPASERSEKKYRNQYRVIGLQQF